MNYTLGLSDVASGYFIENAASSTFKNDNHGKVEVERVSNWKDSMSGYQLWQKHKERVLNNDSIDH